MHRLRRSSNAIALALIARASPHGAGEHCIGRERETGTGTGASGRSTAGRRLCNKASRTGVRRNTFRCGTKAARGRGFIRWSDSWGWGCAGVSASAVAEAVARRTTAGPAREVAFGLAPCSAVVVWPPGASRARFSRGARVQSVRPDAARVYLNCGIPGRSDTDHRGVSARGSPPGARGWVPDAARWPVRRFGGFGATRFGAPHL